MNKRWGRLLHYKKISKTIFSSHKICSLTKLFAILGILYLTEDSEVLPAWFTQNQPLLKLTFLKMEIKNTDKADWTSKLS